MTTLPRSVKPDPASLQGRLDEIRARIARAAARGGRSPAGVTLIAVTKTVPPAMVAEGIALGLTDLGENRVQEAEAKIALLGSKVRWHLIGHLQRNKAGRAVELFERVHSVDDLELAAALERRAAVAQRRLPVLIEVNVSGEPTKFGVAPDGLQELVERVAEMPSLNLDGFMTVGAPVARAEESRAGFELLRRLRDRVAEVTGLALPQLSMGMSGDFEVAVESGSTMVRLGTALFGPRDGRR